ncbi:3-deoxy-D-manno-octulosonic acid transferase [Lacibacter luteus]|uniref:3-deoxy-D-manno-octulosonic acid transferase n=1 Tax=Lacibacter luteus TaxID=2508719 RepID=A0A4Q1CMZ5_9BACT|nr:glycosyltransferase N-terminal domain-containing protein [Lacibacter luteus]RXK62467.1 3-deoxy-D-manno-octulosonic acid transferase [Lacibacter luteus]
MIAYYQLFLFLYRAFISIAATRNSKAKKWVEGRKNWQQQLSSNWKTEPGNSIVWMHCASLGEFEQGRPILEEIKTQNPNSKILLTFFSPSGYEIRKNYNGADHVMYLPMDGASNAKQFLDLIQPDLAVFVKYEFWHYYLAELKSRNIETILVSGIFRPSQPFFQWWGSFHRNMLQNFSHLFVQNAASKELLDGIGLAGKTTVAGDTRFDRVIALAEQWQPVEIADAFCGTDPIIVAGSTWAEDETILAEWMKSNNRYKLIIAPHEIKAENISRLKTLFTNSITFSELSTHNPQPMTHNCLIIDNIGYLSRLYKYATVCYVGGGFNKSGHHNILEAAVYGKPVITGPNFEKFQESVDLKKLGGSSTISNTKELIDVMGQMDISAASTIAENYVKENAGATAAILKWLQEKRLFTNA